ncbi:hypothetical protein L873DRAFT_1846412 [Choiromyces venosus 120613-1]|uniref:Uncharacterized protein n=1 Tax=Choiromyces venosus 120613-1 TaxID=1336337 RepID=A0A3N4JL99_9PEZI|nr:hypothetical protein L873DRAFT_1846412 [Choiromyces venosus 120613-1]
MPGSPPPTPSHTPPHTPNAPNIPNTPTSVPLRSCTLSYVKAKLHIANLRSIRTRIRALKQSSEKFTEEVQKSLDGIEWGLNFFLENDVQTYLFLKKEGLGGGVWVDADLEGLERRCVFWVGAWIGVWGSVGELEEEDVDREEEDEDESTKE